MRWIAMRATALLSPSMIYGPNNLEPCIIFGSMLKTP
jgi:hypothetical protein